MRLSEDISIIFKLAKTGEKYYIIISILRKEKSSKD